MFGAKEAKFSLEVMINKDETKVLFARADSEFVDVLLSFLTLPLGTIVRLLKKHYEDEAQNFGCLNTLYNSVEKLNTSHFWTEDCKLALLSPRNSLESDIDESKWKKLSLFESNTKGSGNHSFGIFTSGITSFLIRDDLLLVPLLRGSIIEILKNLGIGNTVGAKERTVTVGFNEIMDLLKGSLLSQTPLTEIILHKRNNMGPAFKTVNFGILRKRKNCNSERKMALKVVVQSSTRSLKFAEAEEDFVNSLFSFLTITLGEVESLLGNSTSLSNIGNLYGSLPNLNYHRIFHGLSDKVCFSDPKGAGSYVRGPGMYMVGDDLTVTPLCLSSTISVLNSMNIPIYDVKLLEIKVGAEEVLSILSASLTSKFALSNGLKHMLYF